MHTYPHIHKFTHVKFALVWLFSEGNKTFKTYKMTCSIVIYNLPVQCILWLPLLNAPGSVGSLFMQRGIQFRITFHIVESWMLLLLSTFMLWQPFTLKLHEFLKNSRLSQPSQCTVVCHWFSSHSKQKNEGIKTLITGLDISTAVTLRARLVHKIQWARPLPCHFLPQDYFETIVDYCKFWTWITLL